MVKKSTPKKKPHTPKKSHVRIKVTKKNVQKVKENRTFSLLRFESAPTIASPEILQVSNVLFIFFGSFVVFL